MNACPNDEALEAFLDRRAPDRASIEEHLDACAACRALVAHLAVLRTKGTIGGEASTSTVAVSIPSPDTVTTIGRYLVERELGRGAMGVVLLARDPDLDRKVAIKLVAHGTDPVARARLLREARAMAKVSHPNVVAIHDVGELPHGEVYFAMEVVEGRTLFDVIRAKERPPRAEILDLFLQAGRGLAAAHAVGIVHRDFKPANVLLGADGRVRVADFGLARSELEPASRVLTGAGVIVGTPAYMAPEQFLALSTTERTDQYAFCVALFEAIAGERPHPGRGFEGLRDARLRGERRPWPESERELSDLEAAIDRGLERDPERRFPSMRELLSVLEGAAARVAAASPIATVRDVAPARPTPQVPTLVSEASAARAPEQAAPPAPWPEVAGPRPPTGEARPSRASSSVGVAVVAVVVVGMTVMALALGLGYRAWKSAKVTGNVSVAEATPPVIPAFVPIVPNPNPDVRLPCPPGTSQVTVTVLTECRDVNDRREGPSLLFSPFSGRLAVQKVHRGGVREGRSWQFADDGSLTDVVDYHQGEVDGRWLVVEHGRVVSETHYREGVKHGVQRRWSSDQRLSSWQRYDDDKLVEVKLP